VAVAVRLASAGYGAGDPEKVLAMRVDMVLAAMQYEKFKQDYERRWVELNAEDNGKSR
jgi:hypothetical protein